MQMHPVLGSVTGLALTGWVLGAEVKMETLDYGGWRIACGLSNGTDRTGGHHRGPGHGSCGWRSWAAQNLFKEWRGSGREDRRRGMAHLRRAPALARARSEAALVRADNAPVKWDWDGRRLKLSQPVEALTGLQKEIELELAPDAAQVMVLHRLINRSLWSIEAAPWAMSVCLGPGRAIVPQEPYVSHADEVLPARSMTLWVTPTCRIRGSPGDEHVQMRSDPAQTTSQKVGFRNRLGWAAFVRGEDVFLKRFAFDPAAVYADFGCNTEIYTNGDMLELETLGPSSTITPVQASNTSSDGICSGRRWGRTMRRWMPRSDRSCARPSP